MRIGSEYYKTLRKSRLFAGLKETEIEEALSMFGASFREYSKGEMLHGAEEPLKKFGLVLGGTVNVYSDDIYGNRLLMASVCEGCTFGEALCFLKIKDSPMYAETAEKVSVLWLSPAKLFRAGSGGALADRLQKNFTALLADRTLAMNSRIQVLTKLSLRDKLTTYFTEMSRQAGGRTFTIPFDRETMADYLGTNRSALSRELSRMKADGMIDFYKNSFRLLK
ncbi:MAG: Crp/Fnr family transcriptional regulator [Clostridia bacterium]|nr:Crp/Fnr family transcriptional regulator [Clostridia bacterium]